MRTGVRRAESELCGGHRARGGLSSQELKDYGGIRSLLHLRASRPRLYVALGRDAIVNPLPTFMETLPDRDGLRVADLGCGIGNLLPFLHTVSEGRNR